MSATRSLSSVARCARCQRHAVDGFLSLAGISLRRTVSSVPRAAYRSRPQQRHVSTTRRFLEDLNATHISKADPLDEAVTTTPITITQNVEDAELQESLDQESELQDEANAEESDSQTPWYLLEEDDFVPEVPISERQKLPEIPADAPSNFPAILERLSTDIGLDYLTLIDLRTLDPPPALGTGVMMLLGTARSEKHLHVSADRFSRWLRAHYKLTPHADGLLGRNELKLRMKRKAKRARLLGSVGAIQKDEEDDGIKTGWICVDAGIIEHSSSAVRSLDESGIIGFGSQTDGVKLVVQMMTENKRRELDLETLWEKALERHRKRLAAREVVDNPDEEHSITSEDTIDQEVSRRAAVASA